jgi:hypothetical protein
MNLFFSEDYNKIINPETLVGKRVIERITYCYAFDLKQNKLITPKFSQIGGFIIKERDKKIYNGYDDLTEEILTDLYKEFRFSKINLNFHNSVNIYEYAFKTRIKPSLQLTYILDENQLNNINILDEKKPKNKFTQIVKFLSNIRKASIQDIDQIYKISNQTWEKSKLKNPLNEILIERMINDSYRDGSPFKINVFCDGEKVLGFTVFCTDINSSYLIFSGYRINSPSNIRPYITTALILNEVPCAIKEGKQINLKGSINPGIAKFYRSLGGSIMLFPNLDFDYRMASFVSKYRLYKNSFRLFW